ncbi:MAG: hypothetical protein ACPG8W_11515 [Candidatus Promineifilaceae bacterium]
MLRVMILTLVFAGLTTVFTMLWRSRQEQPLGSMGAVAFLSGLLVHAGVIYGVNPSFTHPLAEGYPILLFVSLAISLLLSRRGDQLSTIGSIVSVITFLTWFVLGNVLTSPGLICDNEGANKMARLLQVQASDAIPSDTSPDTLLRVTPKTANLKASRAISSEHNLGAYLELNKTTLQEVNGEWGYVVDFGVHNWRGFRAQGSVVPGYIWVNAEDPFAEAELRLGADMHYVPDARLNNDLARHVYLNYELENNWLIDDLTLEIADDGKPYYTASLLERTIGWRGQEVVGVLIVNPTTGAIVEHLLKDGPAPEWVDRIYSLEWVQKYAGWWATHHQYDVCQFQGTAGQKEIDRVNDVIREEGLVYQVTLTSVGADQSLTDIIYVNPRTGAATRHALSGSTLEGVESLISEAAYNRFTPEECELHQIIGEPTWYCVLNGKGGKGGSYAGVAFVQARYSSEYTKVIRNETLTGGYRALKRQIVAEYPDRADLEEEPYTLLRWRGTLDRKTEWKGDYLISIIGAPPESDAEPTMRWFIVDGNDGQAAFAQIGDDVRVEASVVNGSIYHRSTGFWNYSYPPPKE